MNEDEIYIQAPHFETRQYGPFYIVSGSHARGKTFRAFLLDSEQLLSPNPQVGPNNRHPDLRDNQEVYGVVKGIPGWTEKYGWISTHPNVKDKTAVELLTRLVTANNQAIMLDMHDNHSRAQWLSEWAQQNLKTLTIEMRLPDLDNSESACIN